MHVSICVTFVVLLMSGASLLMHNKRFAHETHINNNNNLYIGIDKEWDDNNNNNNTILCQCRYENIMRSWLYYVVFVTFVANFA